MRVHIGKKQLAKNSVPSHLIVEEANKEIAVETVETNERAETVTKTNPAPRMKTRSQSKQTASK